MSTLDTAQHTLPRVGHDRRDANRAPLPDEFNDDDLTAIRAYQQI